MRATSMTAWMLIAGIIPGMASAQTFNLSLPKFSHVNGYLGGGPSMPGAPPRFTMGVESLFNVTDSMQPDSGWVLEIGVGYSQLAANPIGNSGEPLFTLG